jgi:hypothetical protein
VGPGRRGADAESGLNPSSTPARSQTGTAGERRRMTRGGHPSAARDGCARWWAELGPKASAGCGAKEKICKAASTDGLQAR